MNQKKISGQSLVEFAITLPLIILIVMGVFDLGRGIYYYSAIHNAAREGARYGAINYCDKAGIKAKAKTMAIGLGDSLIVDEPETRYEPGTGELDYVLVSVRYTFEPVTPLIGKFLNEDGAVELKSEARQLIEAPMVCP